MKKRLISLILAIMALVIVAVVGCNNNAEDKEQELNAYKEQAIADIERYADGKGQDNYSEENWTELQEIVRDIITAIETSNGEDEIDGMVLQAKTEMDNIVTYKEQVVAEVESYAQSKGQDNYSEKIGNSCKRY